MRWEEMSVRCWVAELGPFRSALWGGTYIGVVIQGPTFDSLLLAVCVVCAPLLPPTGHRWVWSVMWVREREREGIEAVLNRVLLSTACLLRYVLSILLPWITWVEE
jgi:hypothetical protein